MDKKKLVASVSIMTAAMAVTSPAMEAFAAETTDAVVEFTGDEWDGHPEISQVNRERARATFYPYESVEAAKSMKKEDSKH